jgi:uncharacterized membrane protein
MNAAHLHIALVHFPVVLSPVALVVLLVGMRLRNRSVEGVALSMLVLAALVALPAFLVGEGAEELVEHLSGISEDVIEEHEEAATVAFWLTNLVGALSAVTLVGLWRVAGWVRWMKTLVTIAAVIASTSLFYAAYEGGKIRHPEAYSAGPSEGS